jgi:ATP-dependent protease ClpP protease subunit
MPRIIVLSGPVGFAITAKEVREELAKAKGKPVRFEINSPGGLAFVGIEIFNLIRDYEGETEVRIVGLAASAASYFALAADRVSAFDNATYMIHNAMGLTIGNHNDMRKVASTLEGISNILAKAYAAKTGKSIEEVKSLMDDETFFFGDEILNAGFVDEIIETADDVENEDRDKETALMTARASIEACLNEIRNSDAANEDFQKAVAYMDNMALLMDEPSAITPVEEIEGLADMKWSDEIYEAATPIADTDIEAPFPNEHACRVRDPNAFQKGSFRRITRKADGKNLGIIIGRLKGKTTTTTQAFRYPKGEWRVETARNHCNRNDGKTFEPASGASSAQASGCCDNISMQEEPAVAGQIDKEEKHMTLLEMLAGDATAKAEYDAAIVKAQADATKAAKEVSAAIIAKVEPILVGDAYSKAIKACGIKALKGEIAIESFDAVVVMADQTIEAEKAAAAESENGEETGALGGEEGASAEDIAKYEAKKKRLEGQGV